MAEISSGDRSSASSPSSLEPVCYRSTAREESGQYSASMSLKKRAEHAPIAKRMPTPLISVSLVCSPRAKTSIRQNPI